MGKGDGWEGRGRGVPQAWEHRAWRVQKGSLEEEQGENGSSWGGKPRSLSGSDTGTVGADRVGGPLE